MRGLPHTAEAILERNPLVEQSGVAQFSFYQRHHTVSAEMIRETLITALNDAWVVGAVQPRLFRSFGHESVFVSPQRLTGGDQQIENLGSLNRTQGQAPSASTQVREDRASE